MTSTFAALCAHHSVTPDRHGEAHVACPGCGKPAKRGQTHFSFSESGGYCWVCGRGWRLATLAKLWLAPDWTPPPAPPMTPLPDRHYSWREHADAIAAHYAAHKDAVRLWQSYKPLDAADIAAHRLGVGVLPSSRCRHERLIAPLIDFSGRVVGFRGRALDCDCGKWLSPGGNRATLFNWQSVQPGLPLVITENPVDALLATRLWGRATVATLSVSYWQSEWTEFLLRVRPQPIVVAYDNDAPGNATRADILDAWRATHRCEPPQNGVKLVNRLLAARLPAILYRWPDDAAVKADVGDMFKQIGEQNGT